MQIPAILSTNSMTMDKKVYLLGSHFLVFVTTSLQSQRVILRVNHVLNIQCSKNSECLTHRPKMLVTGAGEVARWLKTVAPFVEDLGLIPSTQMVAPNFLQIQSI